MTNGTLGLLAIAAYVVVIGSIALFFKLRDQGRIVRLRMGVVYVLDKDDPFGCATRAVITDICRGYVQYRYVFDFQGEERLSSPQSCKARSFANMYTIEKEQA